ncbi:L-fucose/L-arabinose isomerase family protein [Thermotoga sp. 38H-to]|uniref:L-fucose/L-arabinose isomerase family protein n=1 Tax=Thermotoga sp. 38H-to TaxID=1755812 RepID=UPI0013E9A7B4|nr:L-fucose/L-arabinose isomerase family protein [Thermotoga sp. 38H-to]KAF2959492.1 fucose isomerase [Thermotoga sp. 38H-to]
MKEKYRVGLISFSDGREYVHRELEGIVKKFEDEIAKTLEETGEVEVIRAKEIVWKPSIAKREARRLAEEGAEVTIFNYAVWAFPHFTVLASKFAPGPFLLFSNINPQYPGMVAMLSAAGALEQDGTKHYRMWGSIKDEKVLRKVMAFIRAGSTYKKLRGQRYGVFGGRSMGMYTAVPNVDLWNKIFGVDVEHIDQFEIVRRSQLIPDERARKGRLWIEEKAKAVHYDGKYLTPEKLELQIKSYHAVREIVEEMELDFVGIKGQLELTEHFVTMDVTEAFLNDPYDWEGEHEPIVCATEADSDGALTMQIFKLIAKTPVLFADVRHYVEEYDVLDLCNSGNHATYFAARSFNPDENMKKVEFYPQTFYFPAGGAAVKHIAAPGKVTLGRLTREDGRYRFTVVPGEFVDFGEEKNYEIADSIQNNWPHAFLKMETPIDEFLAKYSSNHIHGVYGDYVEEIKTFCEIASIDFVLMK